MTTTEAFAPTITDTVVLDSSRFFEPRPDIEKICTFARGGADLVVTLPLGFFDGSPLTGVSRLLCQAWIEGRVHNALRAAGYRKISRRIDTNAVVLVAQA